MTMDAHGSKSAGDWKLRTLDWGDEEEAKVRSSFAATPLFPSRVQRKTRGGYLDES